MKSNDMESLIILLEEQPGPELRYWEWKMLAAAGWIAPLHVHHDNE